MHQPNPPRTPFAIPSSIFLMINNPGSFDAWDTKPASNRSGTARLRSYPLVFRAKEERRSGNPNQSTCWGKKGLEREMQRRCERRTKRA